MRSVEPERHERVQPEAAPTGRPETTPRAPLRLDPSTVLALQRTAGNASVSSLLRGHRAVHRAPAASHEDEVRVVERLPTLPEPGVKYVVAKRERGYQFEVTIEGKPVQFQNLTPAQAVAQLRQVWHIVHSDLDEGRAENLRLKERRKEHRTAGYWSELIGDTKVPDPGMWDEVGSGTLSQVRAVLDSTEAELKDHRDRVMAGADRHLPAELENSPLMREALAFDATEERIQRATRLLERATFELNERWKLLDDHVKDSNRGARHAVTGIKASIVVLSAAAGGAGAGFAGADAGLLAQAAYGAGTMGIVGAADETFTQVGEIRIGEREHLDVARIGKRAARDVVTGFVGGVVGGKFSQVLKGRLGAWVSGLTAEEIAASGLTREQLLGNAERLFVEWVAGSVGSSPFTTAAGHVMDLALDGQLKVHTFGEFAHSVIDDMERSAKLGFFLTYAGHAVNGGAGTGANAGRVKPPAPAAKPRPRGSTGHPKPPKPPQIVSSPKGGFEPTTREPVPDDYGPEPEQVELIPTEATPVRETRNMQDPPGSGPPKRFFHTSVVDVEIAVRKALKLVQEKAKTTQQGPREIDSLVAEIAKTDPEFAGEIKRFYAAKEDVEWVEQQMVHLWEQAAEHHCTAAEELERTLGSGTVGINEFRNTAGPDPTASFAEFKTTLEDARPLVDVTSAGDHHGSHTHAFDQYLGDRLFGRGGGLRFRQKLATFEGPTKTQRAGQKDEYEEPMWAQVWDELFDSSDNLRSPEEIGEILQNHLDFPRWDPGKQP
ncbi:hypothetical protein OM076_02160 [Solirubrobacter ginsenosidimutans]|uniref:Uncharacterized protein n=1 Tax=Solirubrobacter ginsenosidimutans TaxID=490573 RepID=A0A9X3MMW9_9ACTN|nr:hypothetical protein [Solirubrobacter ginsenosidimutans]MDA0159055.1 hypothetical protein [Solirubrobacter ginsenosidimutans]